MSKPDFSYISNAHPDYIDSLYSDYLSNPDSIDKEWKKFFEGFDFALRNQNGKTKDLSPKEFQVFYLINAYRRKGHLEAKTNPIRERIDRNANLDIEDFGLSESDLDKKFHAGEELGIGYTSLRNIIAHLQQIYCGTIGAEFMYIIEPEIKSWFREKMEKRNFKLNIDQKRRIFSFKRFTRLLQGNFVKGKKELRV